LINVISGDKRARKIRGEGPVARRATRRGGLRKKSIVGGRETEKRKRSKRTEEVDENSVAAVRWNFDSFLCAIGTQGSSRPLWPGLYTLEGKELQRF